MRARIAIVVLIALIAAAVFVLEIFTQGTAGVRRRPDGGAGGLP